MSNYSSLWKALEGFHPKDAVVAAVFERLVQFSREFGEAAVESEIAGKIGHITAHARIENQQNTKVLLVYGAKEERWKYPGGHVENGVLETAAREASRALGHEVLPGDCGIFEMNERRISEYWNTPAHTHFEIVFRFVVEETPELLRGAQWFTLKEAFEILNLR